jgi:hypothetical protein
MFALRLPPRPPPAPARRAPAGAGPVGGAVAAAKLAVVAVYALYLGVHVAALVHRVRGDGARDDYVVWLVAIGLVHLALAQVSLRAARVLAQRPPPEGARAQLLRLAAAGHRPDDDLLGASLALVDWLYAVAVAAAWARLASPTAPLTADSLLVPLWLLGVAACLLCFAKTYAWMYHSPPPPRAGLSN